MLKLSLEGDVSATAQPVHVLKDLAESGKIPRFATAVEEARKVWDVICLLEEDLLDYNKQNRWSGALDNWSIVVGECPDMEFVPEYVGWGNVQAWLEYNGHKHIYIITVEREDDEISLCVWTLPHFVEVYQPTVLASCPFADDSGIRLNKVLRKQPFGEAQ